MQGAQFMEVIEWTRWSFCETIRHTFRKYHPAFETLTPSLQLSCKQKTYVYWGAFSGSLATQALFFVDEVASEECQKNQASFKQRAVRFASVGAASAVLSSLVINLLKKFVEKHAQHSKGWSEEQKLVVIRKWACRRHFMMLMTLLYTICALVYVFSFALSRNQGNFYMSICTSLVIFHVVIPTSIAFIVAAIIHRAANDGVDGFDRLLERRPSLCDFSHEHHDHLGHVGRMALLRPLNSKLADEIGENVDAQAQAELSNEYGVQKLDEIKEDVQETVEGLKCALSGWLTFCSDGPARCSPQTKLGKTTIAASRA